jgi:hypothetical protein
MNLLLYLADINGKCDPNSQGFTAICTDTLPRTAPTIWQTGLNLAYAIIGAVAILIIVLAGMRLVFARDNPESISKSRNTIFYAAIGLVIAASAAIITNFIIGRLGK